jgi:hypothetical protein
VLKPLYFGKFMEVPGVLMYLFLEKLGHIIVWDHTKVDTKK